MNPSAKENIEDATKMLDTGITPSETTTYTIPGISTIATTVAATLPQEDGAKISWWWLLIIALLGATGKKMYDDHIEKKRAVEMAADDENKD
ncbi:MAG: hypothetical protein K6A71_12445 [Lachnospiraceae bacterium]|nr:hypothetical protein [Lachnospiraceae bacterium]